MLEPLFFALGLANNLFLLAIFLLRSSHPALITRLGRLYFVLAGPAVYGIVLVQQEQKPMQYAIFLGLFLAFLAIEALYDWVLRIPFRQTMDWRLLLPYVALYMSSSYGFVVMVWRNTLAGGIVMLVLFVAQITANVLTHRCHPQSPVVDK